MRVKVVTCGGDKILNRGARNCRSNCLQHSTSQGKHYPRRLIAESSINLEPAVEDGSGIRRLPTSREFHKEPSVSFLRETVWGRLTIE